MGRENVVHINTRYGLDGSGMESPWCRDFPHPQKTGTGTYLAYYTIVAGSLPRIKRSGRGVNNNPT